jgi:DNA-3-methyladenine glycosylase
VTLTGGAADEGPVDVSLSLDGPVLEVAQRILGWRVRTSFDGIVTEVALTEVEAYAGDEDPASHAYRGRTDRNAAMFGPPGTLYVYRSYGIHWCMNVVVREEGVAHAVLMRGGEVIDGEHAIRRRRGRADQLTNGPGKLSQALGVTGDHNGTSMTTGPVRLIPGELSGGTIVATPRVGISKAVDRPWRFVIAR